jgi:Ribbon-helix-helix protein, copG family
VGGEHLPGLCLWHAGVAADGTVKAYGKHLAQEAGGGVKLTCVTEPTNMTHMEKTQVYLPKKELDALRAAAARSGRSVAEIIRDAIRQVVLKPPSEGPVAIWDGEPKRTSLDHDSVYDDP